MEDLGNESSSTIKNKRSANIRAPFDIIDWFGSPSGSTKKLVYNDHNRDNPNLRLKYSW